MRVLLTGAAGFLGWHTRCRLHALTEHDVVAVTRSTWDDLPTLAADADAIIHVAGINRADPDEVRNGNAELARAVAAAARVERAMAILGDDVPDHLAEAGQLRVQHRQASLEELGRLADPQMTKDAVAGRIRRLLSMADKRASELGIPDTQVAISEEILEDL
nr:DNA-binding protein WhiA [Corynebacterium vitaeruminis]